MAQTRAARLIASLVLVAGSCVFAFTLARATLFPAVEPEAPAPPHMTLATSSPTMTPVRLKISSINIDAAVQRVGIGKSGAMGVPSNFTDVAWYKYGVAPGELGSAVIDGHVDNGLSLDGVFKHLNEVKVGDDISVVDSGGIERHFTVSEVAIYGYKSVPTDRVFNQNDTARLNLVTCDGAWVKGEKTYDQRLVVYAVLTS